MSQATIASRPAHEHGALLSRSGPQARRNLRIETDALTEALLLDGKRCTGVRYSRRRRARARRARRARSWSAPARSTRRNCWSCRASASPSGCARSASRCAMRCPASARTCATITRRARAGRSATRASPSTTAAAASAWCSQALRYAFSGEGLLGMVGAPIRAFVRSREGLEAPDLLLGWVPMLTEPGPKGPQHRAPVGHDLLRPSDAARRARAHPHRLGRSAQAAGDQLQLPVVAGRRRAHGARRPHRPRDHDRAGAWPPCR